MRRHRRARHLTGPARDCPKYVASFCYPGVPPGHDAPGIRCEDLEQLTFGDAQFDLVITQEVFEHVFDYRKAFREVMRTVRAGGAHVFTTPKYKHLRRTRIVQFARMVRSFISPTPEYHGNPIDASGPW